MTANDRPRWAALTVPPQARSRPGGPRCAAPAAELVLSGTVAAADVAALCQEVTELLAGGRARLVVCDVAGLTGPGLATVEALARIQLTVRGLGHRIQFRRVPREVLELLVLAGLDRILPITGNGESSGGPDR